MAKEIDVLKTKMTAKKQELDSIKKISETECKEYKRGLVYECDEIAKLLKSLKAGENEVDSIAEHLNKCNEIFEKVAESEEKVRKIEQELEDLDSGVDAEENSTEETETTTDETPVENTEDTSGSTDENDEQANEQRAEKQEESFHNFLSNSACRFLKE
jgi:hypothetical protein